MSKRSRIAIFIDWFEPGFKAGGPIRSVANFVYHLSDTYEIYIITSDRDLDDDRSYDGLLTDGWIDRQGYKIFYTTPGYLNFFSTKKLLEQAAPDWIYINGMFSWSYSILPVLVRTFFYRKSSVLLAPRGMLKDSALQFKKTKKGVFLKLFKALYIQQNIIFQATDTEEKRAIISVFGKDACVALVPNFPGRQNEFIPIRDKKRGELRMIFISRVHPIKNLEYLLNILPEIAAKTELTIIGAIENKEYWKRCQDLIALTDSRVSITIKENIPHAQLEKILINHHLFVLPTLGENFGHAIFESLAAGRPVLISDQTPWRNLTENHVGWDIPLTEPSEFREVIMRVANMNADELNVWCKGAWLYCHRYLTANNLRKNYIDLFESKN
jgi:glycosyltransferase involved in cell wall biosynthesis